MEELVMPVSQKVKWDFGYLIRIKDKHSPKAPDMEGQIGLAGVRYDLAGWVRVSKRGVKYLSLSARRHEEGGLADG
jgi:hypothetical protein